MIDTMIIHKVTKLEKQVLEALAAGMYAELGYSDIGHEDIAEMTGLPIKVIRGVAGSLTAKRLISIDDREGEGYKNKTNMHIWYLTHLSMGLVEHWVGETLNWYNNDIIEKVKLEINE
jgi:hypothetical protein